MNTYVSLINWTEQGIREYRDTTQRAEAFTKLIESTGGHVRELVWTGSYSPRVSERVVRCWQAGLAVFPGRG